MADEDEEMEEWRRRLFDAVELLKAGGESESSISTGAGFGPTFVRDLFKRRQTPSVENVQKFCKYLGIEYETLMSKEPRSSEDIAHEMQNTALRRAFKEAQEQPFHIQKLIIEGMKSTLRVLQSDEVKSVQRNQKEPLKTTKRAEHKEVG